MRLAGIGQRFGAWFMELVLAVVTLVIGYVIWLLIVMGRGQTPGKQVLGIRAARPDGTPAGWGRTFLREFVAKFVILSLFTIVTLGIGGILGLLWALWDKDRQTLYDKLAGTIVIDDRAYRQRQRAEMRATATAT